MRIEYLNHPLLSQFFTWNKQYAHPKLTCLPIGLNQDRQLHAMRTFLISEKNHKEKSEFFAVNLSVNTNSERINLLNIAKTKWATFCTFIDNIPFSKTYWGKSKIEGQIRIDVTNPECYKTISKYKFILSPPGGWT